MKNKKGFTLVELVIVMLLITIITFAAYPNFASMSTKAKAKYDAGTRLLMRSAASMYVNNNIDEVNAALASHGNLCIPIGKLIAYEYLDSDLKDSNNNEINPLTCVNVSKETTDGNTKYKYEVTNQLFDSTKDYLPPIITLKSKTSGVECKKIMNATLEYFNQNCTVGVTDDRANPILQGPRQSVGRDPKKLFLEYNAVDQAGNKAVPLTVELITG